jgi:hypothetical protein
VGRFNRRWRGRFRGFGVIGNGHAEMLGQRLESAAKALTDGAQLPTGAVAIEFGEDECLLVSGLGQFEGERFTRDRRGREPGTDQVAKRAIRHGGGDDETLNAGRQSFQLHAQLGATG